MGARSLDLTIRHRNRHEDTFQAHGDPDDADFAAWLQGQLRSWLRSHGWHAAKWSEFEIEAFERTGRKNPAGKARG